MPIGRIAAAGALSLALVAAAAAQTAPGKPLPLLQIAQLKTTPKLHAHARTPAKLAERKSKTLHIAVLAAAKPHKHLRHMIARTAAPSPDATAAVPALAETAAPTPATPPPAIVAVPTPVAPPPAVVAVPMQTVADNAPSGTLTDVTAVTNVQMPPTSDASPPAPAAAVEHDAPAKPVVSDSGAPSPPAVRAMVVTAEPQNAAPVGSFGWTLRVLAALVGAIAAGAVAWFLIGPAPRRDYSYSDG